MLGKHSICPEIFFWPKIFPACARLGFAARFSCPRSLVTAPNQLAFSSPEVFLRQGVTRQASLEVLAGHRDFPSARFSSSGGYSPRGGHEGFPALRLLGGFPSTEGGRWFSSRGAQKKRNGGTQLGAIFPSSFLNRSECLGSIKWQSS